MSANGGAPFLSLLGVFGDAEMAEIFSQRGQVESWLAVERALAEVQGELGIIPAEAAAAIVAEASVDKVDPARLHEDTRRVGYPILPLLEQLAQGSSPEVGAYIHWGATTQDIMDTGLVLQITRGLRRVEELELALVDRLADAAAAYRSVPMPARTHAQQAVPTTFGLKLAVWTDELNRHGERLRQARSRAAVVQLFGAGGTAAALGQASREVRLRLASRLGMGAADVPWHTARDGIAEIAFVLGALAGTCGKIGREIIELSRTEVAELREEAAPGSGASSTMPQKVNPVLSEVAVGMSALARAQVAPLLESMLAGHERSAGEWQIEWDALPLLFAFAAGSAKTAALAIDAMQVFPERMLANLSSDGGLVMAEAVMIALAPVIGRLPAHELVAGASRIARERSVPLAEVLPDALGEELMRSLPPLEELLSPAGYLGEAEAIVDAVLARVAAARALAAHEEALA
jgi:3-carboxy-cis,cis-muconate cycloisomerase